MLGVGSVFKFFIYFSLSFLILSFPVANSRFFDLLYSKTHRLTSPIYGTIGTHFSKAFNQAKDYGRKVFSNATPRMDLVDHSSSSWERARGMGETEVFSHDEETALRERLKDGREE